MYEYAGAYGFKDEIDGDDFVRLRMQEIEASAKHFEGTGDDDRVQPGRMFRLTGHRDFSLLEQGDELRRQLDRNATRFRAAMTDAGFTLAGDGHPIIPVMLGDARIAGEMAERMLAEGVYVIAFSYPVVPLGTARIRTQMSAAHDDADIDAAVAAFVKVGRTMGVVP